MTPPQRKGVTLALLATALVGFFAWGFGFDLFGKRITLDWQHLGMFAWLVVGAFAIGFRHGLANGLKRSLQLAVLMAAALLLGYLRGNYS